MPLDRSRPPAMGKNARLQKWGDDEGEFAGEFGDAEDDFLAQLNDSNNELLSPADEFATIKLAPVARGISPSATDAVPRAAKEVREKKTVSSAGLARFVERDDDELSFGEDVQIDNLRGHAFSPNFLSPGTGSLTSPVRRHSLSEFSESTDTDITEINDEDFEEIDDIFGKEESGIYSSGGTRASKKSTGPGRAREVLLQRKQQLEEEAKAEDDELFRRFKSRDGQTGGYFDMAADEVNTLKLKDLRLFTSSKPHHDTLENDATINYEYTKDDFESFEDGFVGDLPSVIRQDKLSHFHTDAPAHGRPLSRKASMPVFPRSLKASGPTKFKSTMDLGHAFGESSSEHPLFNNKNKIIRKLDRMPSFHIKKSQAPPSLPHVSSKEDLLDYNMELHKKQLLEKYMEISEKQFQLRSSPKKKSSNRKLQDKPAKKGVGIVRYLNNKSTAPLMTGNDKMKFNPGSEKWEGNEHELLRFDDNNDDGLVGKRQKQPSLITVDQFRHQKKNVKSNMVYDAENLRWVNKDALDEQQENVFDDLPDLVPNDIPRYNPSAQPPSRLAAAGRGVSAITQRTVSTASSASTANSAAGEEFALSTKLMAKFEKEEQKIRKKTHHWFGANESYHLHGRGHFDADYYWEIRKMVMDNGS
ncbi:hypothetical protein OXX79_005830 [Metschnikowia pulcherrima]